ncbi:MAG: ubiquinone biosynthesis protein COQ7 [Clostridia bacterium]|nr:ubiquinone biosynthesis protein COQ7 [Clostridia bacterium]
MINFNTRFMTDQSNRFEILQQARKDLMGEIEAIIQYDYHASLTQEPVAKQTWISIKNEELTHVGELLALLNYLEPTQKKYIDDGIKEFNDFLNKTR